jgi:hypothetical protein
MRAFLDRVNANLPVAEPDHILLALVEGEAKAVCGTACPRGQGATDAGRCLPNALLVRGATTGAARAAAAKSVPAVAAWVTTTTISPPASAMAPHERMALAGPLDATEAGVAPQTSVPAPNHSERRNPAATRPPLAYGNTQGRVPRLSGGSAPFADRVFRGGLSSF